MFKFFIKKLKFIIILLIILIYYPLLLKSNWQMFRGNHYLTGNNDDIVPEDNKLNWKFIAPSFLFYPVSDKKRVLISSLDKNLYCLDEINGNILWKRTLDSAVIKSSVTYKNYVAITAGDFIYVLNLTNGNIIWSRKEGISIQLSTPIILDDIIYYGSRKFFYARYLRNGHLIWENRNVKIYGGSPIFWNNRIFFLSKNFNLRRSVLQSLDAKTGKLLWKVNIPSYANIYTPMVFNNKVYIGVFNILYAFDAYNGELVWRRKFSSYIASNSVINNNSIYLSLMNGKILKISPEDGKIIKLYKNFNKKGANFIIVGDSLFIPTDKGDIISYDMNLNKINWKFHTHFSNRHATLSANNGRLYVAIATTLYSISSGILPPPSSQLLASSISANNNIKNSSSNNNKIANPIKDKVVKEKEFTLKLLNKEKIRGDIIVSQNNLKKKYSIKNNQAKIKINPQKDVNIIVTSKDYFIKSRRISPDELQNKNVISLKLEKIKKNKGYTFHNINFKYNSSALTSDSIPTLLEIVKFLKIHPDIKIEIRGYTDNIGSKKFNLKLSQKRAEAVKEFLVKNGINETRLKAKGFGETNPIAPNNTEEGRAKNRRTEFFILK